MICLKCGSSNHAEADCFMNADLMPPKTTQMTVQQRSTFVRQACIAMAGKARDTRVCIAFSRIAFEASDEERAEFGRMLK